MSTTRRGRREAERRPLPPCWLEAQLPYSSVLFDFLDTYKVRGVTVLCSARRWWKEDARTARLASRVRSLLYDLRGCTMLSPAPRTRCSLSLISPLSSLCYSLDVCVNIFCG